MKCKKHNTDLECMGGRSAHPSNWYCPTCDKESELKEALIKKIEEETAEDSNEVFKHAFLERIYSVIRS